MSKPHFGEDTLNWVWNRCVNDAFIKSAAAGSLGYLGTRFFMKQSKSLFGASWPIYLTVGMALGLAWHNCEREFQNALTIPCEDTKVKKSKINVSEEWL
ncbi:hypothetical protein O3M35_008810 [Rhynocoris fuscipes]|uniref:MICOS complex subunit MIC10 n=1 Tax=Rhynocoris fuscipes TaxID=488301 RepID=A0AAW1D876_9HEMI